MIIHRLLVPLLVGCVMMTLAPIMYADHEGPERVIPGKYVVVLSVQPQEEAVKFIFFFRDIHTGKSMTVPITGSIDVISADSQEPIATDTPIVTHDGQADVSLTLPKDGLYDITLRFYTDYDPSVIHTPAPWQVWVPGIESGPTPAFGLSEWLGLAMVATVVVLLLLSVLQQRRRKTSMHRTNSSSL